MTVQIYNFKKYPINRKNILNIIENFCRVLKIKERDDFELSIAFVSNSEIKKINRTYRHINKETDVLSFGSLSARKNKYEELAEIVISYEKVCEQACHFRIQMRDEIKKLLIHGLLHLKGYDHQSEKEAIKMEKLEEKLINTL